MIESSNLGHSFDDIEDLTWMPGWRIRDEVISRRVSSEQVVEHFLARIHKLDPVLHAFLRVDVASARKQAQAADAALKRGDEPGFLHGVPVAVKDHIAVEGLPWPRRGHQPNNGTPINMEPAKADSIVVERLRRAGAIIVGNTIMPGMGLGPDMDDLARHPRNPWNPELVPGSSSAGSAAAVSSGMLPICIGSDGGGSTRLPSALCGVVGLHPTTGRVPNTAYDSTRLMLTVTFGPISRDIRDTAITLKAIAGPDGRDILSTVHGPAPDYVAGLDQSAAGLRLAWTDDFGFARKFFTPDSESIVAQTRQAAMGFLAIGATIDTPDVELEEFWPHVASTMYHYEGAPQPESVMRVAMETRGRNRAKFDFLLEHHDFVMSTTIPFTAPSVQKWNDNWKDGNAFAPIYTSETFMCNWLQLPAISIPIGLHKGLPIGLQLIGKPNSEPRMLAAAASFMKRYPQVARPPIS